MDMKFKKIQKGKYIVEKINKKRFISELQDNTNLSYDECLIVNDTLPNSSYKSSPHQIFLLSLIKKFA